MEYGLDVFLYCNVDWINVRWDRQYYSILTIALLSAKKKRKSLVIKSVRKFKASFRTKNESRNFMMEEEGLMNPSNGEGKSGGLGGRNSGAKAINERKGREGREERGR